MQQTAKFSLCAGALFAGTGVVLGAWGAHGLTSLVPDANTSAWDTAVLYQLVHGLALMLNAVWLKGSTARALTVSTVAFALGICLFSGSLYALVLGAPSWLGPITPLGGSAFIVGWIAMVAFAWRDYD